jgi:ABC-type polar amino acid transport system ATPase subunit
MIRGKNVSLIYKNKSGLHNVSFDLQPGKITTFMGRSGAGKTTLLKCISNLYSHYEGTITCDGKNLKGLSPIERASTIGVVLQQFHLFPHLTALQNCTLALVQVLGVAPVAAETKAIEVLCALGMQPWMHSLPSELSGGQQQRVAIARALVLSPKILLLDEPTSALDPENKKSLELLLAELNKQGITIGISSHDMPFIRAVTDFAYFMENGILLETWDSNHEDLSSKPKIEHFLSHQ